MTSLHPRLAGLLRVAAEKEPEKFEVHGHLWAVRTEKGRLFIRLDMIADEFVFSLDHMDAIASAMGMRFDIHFDWKKDVWWLRLFELQDGEWVALRYCEPGEFPDKRTASLAALCAILEHRYGPTTGETK